MVATSLLRTEAENNPQLESTIKYFVNSRLQVGTNLNSRFFDALQHLSLGEVMLFSRYYPNLELKEVPTPKATPNT